MPGFLSFSHGSVLKSSHPAVLTVKSPDAKTPGREAEVQHMVTALELSRSSKMSKRINSYDVKVSERMCVCVCVCVCLCVCVCERAGGSETERD